MRNNCINLCNFFCLNIGGLSSVYVTSFWIKAANIFKICKKAQLHTRGHRGKQGQLLGANPTNTARATCSGGSIRCSPTDISETQTLEPSFQTKVLKCFDAGAGDRRQLRVLAFSPCPCFSNQDELDVAPFEQSTTAPSLLQGKPISISSPAIS